MVFKYSSVLIGVILVAELVRKPVSNVHRYYLILKKQRRLNLKNGISKGVAIKFVICGS